MLTFAFPFILNPISFREIEIDIGYVKTMDNFVYFNNLCFHADANAHTSMVGLPIEVDTEN